MPDREVLAGILFVLRTGIAWEHLPQRFGCGSGMTCWRRLREWQQGGIWQKIRRLFEEYFDGAEDVDWARAWKRAARTRPRRRVVRRVPERVAVAAHEPAVSRRRLWEPGRSEPA